jgi:hypothetical protein
MSVGQMTQNSEKCVILPTENLLAKCYIGKDAPFPSALENNVFFLSGFFKTANQTTLA